jgi:signal transduction histidine kinase
MLKNAELAEQFAVTKIILAWNKLISIGVKIQNSPSLCYKIKATNAITFIYQLAFLLYSGRYFYYHDISWVPAFISVILLFTVYYLNFLGWYFFSRIVLIFLPFCLSTFYKVLASASYGFIGYIFGQNEIVILLIVFLVFDLKEFKVLLCVAFVYYLLIITFPFYYEFLLPSDIIVKPLIMKHRYLVATCNFLISGFTIYTISYRLMKSQGVTERLFDKMSEKNRMLRKSENQLQAQNNDLLKINDELDKFVYSASHDLRAPVLSIKGVLNIIKNHPDDGNKIDYVAMIEKNIERLDWYILGIVNQSQNSRLDLKEDAIDFNDLFKSSLKFIVGNEKSSVQILTKFKIDRAFYSDYERLRIIFTNLISNSINFRDTSKPLSTLVIEVCETNEYAEIKFIDNGIGIAKEYVNNIFEMFFRAHDHSVGSGLGLYIVKGILDKLGAKLTVETNVGSGTTMQLTVPNMRYQVAPVQDKVIKNEQELVELQLIYQNVDSANSDLLPI